jgi:hypothetical protein
MHDKGNLSASLLSSIQTKDGNDIVFYHWAQTVPPASLHNTRKTHIEKNTALGYA